MYADFMASVEAYIRGCESGLATLTLSAVPDHIRVLELIVQRGSNFVLQEMHRLGSKTGGLKVGIDIES